MGSAYNSLSVMLFGCLVSMASMSIQAVIEDVQTYRPAHDIAGHRVLRWKKSYDLILSYVEEVNEFFGPALLIFMGRVFLEFTLRSTGMITFYPRNFPNHLASLTGLSILVISITSNTEDMKDKARHCCKSIKLIIEIKN